MDLGETNADAEVQPGQTARRVGSCNMSHFTWYKISPWSKFRNLLRGLGLGGAGKPEACSHIALKPIRPADIVWSEEELGDYDRVSGRAAEADERVANSIKRTPREVLGVATPGGS